MSYRRALVGGNDSTGDMPDATLALAAVSAIATSPSTITGLHTLRVKETDRVAALANELRKIGCSVETTDDSITIDPSTRHDEPVIIETYNDHRMAMAFAVLGLARPNIAIANPKCVSKSYPGFWRDFARLYEQKT
jgi:3-phosphoshikimate 1-carboxyvinyltransferase